GSLAFESAFVDLVTLERAAILPEAVALALGVVGRADQEQTLTLAEALRNRALLLVLDNCEHIVEAAARLVDILLRSCPNLRLLPPSREPIGVAGERTWLVPPLATPAPDAQYSLQKLGAMGAIRLFVDRASTGLSEFELTAANAGVVADICRRLEGIPLALELAAARLRAVGGAELAVRLQDRLRLLGGTNPPCPAPHQPL